MKKKMIKIGVLLPVKEMIKNAQKLAEEEKIELAYVKLAHTVDAVSEARNAIEAGAQIIIARGYQAKLIKRYTNIPVVEMRFSAQEIGLIIEKAKRMVPKEHIHVGLIAFENMLCDLSHAEELFNVKLSISTIKKAEDAGDVLRQYKELGVDIIIGGETTIQAALDLGFPTLFYQSTDESFREALISARQLAYVIEQEKRSDAQFEAVLDTSPNIIIRVNSENRITAVNKYAESFVGADGDETVGKSIYDIIPQIDERQLNSILAGESESVTSSISLKGSPYMLLITPIKYEASIAGAIIMLSKVLSSQSVYQRNQNSLLHGFTALNTFKDIQCLDKNALEVLESAKIFALSDSPVLIYSENGLEAEVIGEAIHNNSQRRIGPYVYIDMLAFSKDEQENALFSKGSDSSEQRPKGALVTANNGTVFIKNIDRLSLPAQLRLAKTLYSKNLQRTDAHSMIGLNIRIIACTSKNLQTMMQNGDFSEELYYALEGLSLELPPLRQRPEDLKYMFTEYIRQFGDSYQKRLVPTEGAYKKLVELQFTGNMIQLRSFCERLVLSAKKRSLDEVAIQKLYESLYPGTINSEGRERLVVYRSPESRRLAELLQKHGGNRKSAAAELGISTTTLWRRMKKYGIEADFKV